MNIFIWSQSEGNTNNGVITKTIKEEHEKKGDSVYVLTAETASFDAEAIASYQNEITKADMVYLAYPVQWGSYPNLFKKTLDTILGYGFAYKKDDTGVVPLLTGKKGKVITTSAHPNEYYVDQLKAIHYLSETTVFRFTGILPLGSLNIGGRTHAATEGLDTEAVRAFVNA